LKFLHSGAQPMEIAAGALALVTLNGLISRFPEDNRLKRVHSTIKQSPQAMIGWIAKKVHDLNDLK